MPLVESASAAVGPPTASDEWWGGVEREAARSRPEMLFVDVPARAHLHHSRRGVRRRIRSASHPRGLPKCSLSVAEAESLANENYLITRSARVARNAVAEGSTVIITTSGIDEGSGPFIHPDFAALLMSGFDLVPVILEDGGRSLACVGGPRSREVFPRNEARSMIHTDPCSAQDRPPEGARSAPGQTDSEPSADPWGPTAPVVRDAPARGHPEPTRP